MLVLLVADGGLLLTPSNGRSVYVLIATLIMMAALLIFPRIKLFSDEERRARPIWILFGVANVCAALVIMLFDFSPGSALPWMMGILFVSGQVTSIVLIQHLKNRKIIF
jgi:phosphatidylserine synthase